MIKILLLSILLITQAQASTIFESITVEGNTTLQGSTASTVPYLNGSKVFTSSAVTPTELGYLAGVTSAIQTQLNGKETSVAATTAADYFAGDKTFLNFDTSVRAATLTGFVSGAGAITAADTVLSAVNKLVGNLALKAPLASPALTGVPTAPTAALGNNSTQIATTAYADASSLGVLASSVTDGDTTHAPDGNSVFDELSLKLTITDFGSTFDTALATKTADDLSEGAINVYFTAARARASVLTTSIMSGDTTHAPDGDTIFNALALKAPLASPALTGNPTAPTQAPADNSTKIATTAYADAAATAAASGFIVQTITNGDTTHASSSDALFDALALKESLANKDMAGGYAGLDGGGKILASQLPNSVMELQGDYDASTNTPTLIDGTGNPGDVYVVNAAGTQDFGSGNITFSVGDYAIYGGSGVWFKSINSNTVTSVNGYTGVVSLNATDIGLPNVTNDAQLKAADKDTDGTLAANSDAKIPSQKAVKTYVDTLIAGIPSAPVSSVFGRTGIVVAATSDYDAIQVDNTPAGNIAATNAQAAINELDTEKQSVLTNSAGLASAISDETGTGVVVFSASPALTGSPTAPTQSANDNSTKIATTAYVASAISGLTPPASSNITGNTTLSSATARYYFGDTTGGTFTVTLPAAASNDGISFTAKNVTFGGASISVARTGADTIEGATSDSITAGEGKTYVSNGTNWFLSN